MCWRDSSAKCVASAFIPDYHPEEIMEIAQKLYAKANG